MGRAKLPIKRIENTTNRQVTFSKRRNGLIKKAYELSVLCDIDIALIMFSPSGRVSHFSGRTSIEDVFARFVNLDDQERESDFHNKESLLRILTRLRNENDLALHQATLAVPNPNTEELQQQIATLQQKLQEAEEEIRSLEQKYKPDLLKKTSMEEVEQCETHLLDTLQQVLQRKEDLLANCAQSSYDQYNPGIAVQVPSNSSRIEEIDQWLPEASPNNSEFFLSSDQSLGPARGMSSTIHQPLVQEMPSNINLQNIVEPCISNPSGEGISAWPQDYTSNSLHNLSTQSSTPFLYPQVEEQDINTVISVPGDEMRASDHQAEVLMTASSQVQLHERDLNNDDVEDPHAKL